MRFVRSSKLVAQYVCPLPHLGEYLCVFRVGGKVFQLSGVDHEVVEVFILLFLFSLRKKCRGSRFLDMGNKCVIGNLQWPDHTDAPVVVK